MLKNNWIVSKSVFWQRLLLSDLQMSPAWEWEESLNQLDSLLENAGSQGHRAPRKTFFSWLHYAFFGRLTQLPVAYRGKHKHSHWREGLHLGKPGVFLTREELVLIS